jgi:translation initiation factor eIF-2B subunit beta
LVEAAPKELTIGNIVRRVLGLVREEADQKRGGDGSEFGSGAVTPQTEMPSFIHTGSPNGIAQPRESLPQRPPLFSSTTGAPTPARQLTSMFSILSHPTMRAPDTASPAGSGNSSPQHTTFHTDLRAEILDGIAEIIDELDQADDQIANYALDHIHPSETIFTYGSSLTVQRFLLAAAKKRKFTVIHAEGYPNSHTEVHAIVTGNHDAVQEEMDVDSFQKPLIGQGIRVILIPDSNVFALISRATKCVLSANAVLSNGAFVAPSGTKPVVKAARFHRIPTLVLAATYKLSPVYPYDKQEYVEYGDLNSVIEYQDQEMRRGLKELRNPLTEMIDRGEVDLFLTNLGGVSAGEVGRVIRDQYWEEDVLL